MRSVKKLVKAVPVIGPLMACAYRWLRAKQARYLTFPGSKAYWEQRYVGGGTSGAGSYGKFADFKAMVLNQFVKDNAIRSVIEFGCGDGNQVELAEYPTYLGFDVSKRAVLLCRKRFGQDPTKRFQLVEEYRGERAELALSLDVIYHLVEDPVFEDYMARLLDAAERYVVIYSSDVDDNTGRDGAHIRHRKVTQWIARSLPNWRLIKHIPNPYPYKGDPLEGSFADFHIFERMP